MKDEALLARITIDPKVMVGKPVLMDAKTYEKHLRAANMSRLLAPAEADVAAGRVRSVRSFLKEFKHARKISG